MHYPEFARRFRDAQEIGRYAIDGHLLTFYDTGAEVGLWCEDCRTTQGTVLGTDDAEMVRSWYRNRVGQSTEAERESRHVGSESPADLSEVRP